MNHSRSGYTQHEFEFNQPQVFTMCGGAACGPFSLCAKCGNEVTASDGRCSRRIRVQTSNDPATHPPEDKQVMDNVMSDSQQLYWERDFSKAPRDGTSILVWLKKQDRAVFAWWRESAMMWIIESGGGYVSDVPFSAWARMPEAPVWAANDNNK